MNNYPSILLCVVLLIGATTLTSCQNNPTRFSQSDQYFPNSVGDRWTYAVYDSTNNDMFEVNVSIVGETTLSNGIPAKVWQYQWPDKVDTNYVQIKGQRVLIHDGKNVDKSYTTIFLEFPLMITQKWGKVADSSQVIDQHNITAPAGTFNGAYEITRYRQSFNYHVTERYSFKSGIGLIKLYRNEFNFSPPTIQNWQLVAYTLQD